VAQSAVAPLDDLHGHPRCGAGPVEEILAAVALVGPDVSQPGEEVPGAGEQHLRALAVIEVGRADAHSQHQAEDVDQQVPLDALHLLPLIPAPG
jgi:hypothetical protein